MASAKPINVDGLYKFFYLDKCPQNSEHSVDLVMNDPKIFFCHFCNVIFGLDDSCSPLMEDIIKYARYYCKEKCLKCDNDDPNLLVISADENGYKLTCVNCNQNVDLAVSDDQKSATQKLDVTNNGDNEGIAEVLELFECHCGSHECSWKFENNKIQEIKCQICGHSRFYNESFNDYRRNRDMKKNKDKVVPYRYRRNCESMDDKCKKKNDFKNFMDIIDKGSKLAVFVGDVLKIFFPGAAAVVKFAEASGTVADFLRLFKKLD